MCVCGGGGETPDLKQNIAFGLVCRKGLEPTEVRDLMLISQCSYPLSYGGSLTLTYLLTSLTYLLTCLLTFASCLQAESNHHYSHPKIICFPRNLSSSPIQG